MVLYRLPWLCVIAVWNTIGSECIEGKEEKVQEIGEKEEKIVVKKKNRKEKIECLMDCLGCVSAALNTVGSK